VAARRLPSAGRRPIRGTRPAYKRSPTTHAAAHSRHRNQIYPHGRRMPSTAPAVAPSQPVPLPLSSSPTAPTNEIEHTGVSASNRATAPARCRRSDAATCRSAPAKGGPTARVNVATARSLAVAAVVAA